MQKDNVMITIDKPSFRERKGFPEKNDKSISFTDLESGEKKTSLNSNSERKKSIISIEYFEYSIHKKNIIERTNSTIIPKNRTASLISTNNDKLIQLVEKYGDNNNDDLSITSDNEQRYSKTDIKFSEFNGTVEITSTIINDYIIIKSLGSGSYGNVFLAYDNIKNRLVAMKVIHLSDENTDKKYKSAMREVSIIKDIKHENIASIYEIIYDENNYIFIVMDFISGGHILKKNPFGKGYEQLLEKDVKKYMYDIVSGLHYLHSRKIIHKDIKPENILVDSNGKAKIVDFGISEIVNDDCIINENSGTLMFCAPEMFRNNNAINGIKVDVWSLGITLYLMLYGMFPFDGNNYDELKKSIMEGELKFPDIATDVQKNLIMKMLEKNPESRCTLREVKKHPFLRDIWRRNARKKCDNIDYSMKCNNFDYCI